MNEQREQSHEEMTGRLMEWCWHWLAAAGPDVTTFTYDESSGYYYDAVTGYYYDAGTQVCTESLKPGFSFTGFGFCIC